MDKPEGWAELVELATKSVNEFLAYHQITGAEMARVYDHDDDEVVPIPRSHWKVWEWKTDYAQRVLDQYPDPDEISDEVIKAYQDEVQSNYELDGYALIEKTAEYVWMEAVDEVEESWATPS